ncbi:MAG: aminotransferase class V-fold PLP-dependent enzyme [Chitinophagales bacterium]|nr:aminotransferase class V-fold PLP-dependent enzyme [Bacteroidota bacterium]MCB9043651.1 aminotransferase class V-fold PLP-dependent enzyme [Chitinophagales bacterium]
MLEKHFQSFARNIVGQYQFFHTPYGKMPLLYADWIASGRMYAPIEDFLRKKVLPFVGNTHTETSVTGTSMTLAYDQSRKIIKKHVNANAKDVLIFAGSGMTGAINKLQRILGLKVPERLKSYLDTPALYATTEQSWAHTEENRDAPFDIPAQNRPIVFITHMEHHSNHTSWLETIADVEMINADEQGLVDLAHFDTLLEQYQDRKWKIASVTACSNVTGIETPYFDIAEKIHTYGGYCFVDFACSAPYVDIDMHPANRPEASLDAIFISPHKFLGGPGTAGLVIFNSDLYQNRAPDCPGGGTVTYTNPWRYHEYIADIEAREDGGTPPFLQSIKTAMAIKLKEAMGTENIRQREHYLVQKFITALQKMPSVQVLAANHQNRLGVVSFYIENMHFNLVVKLLNDRFGVQMRGGCACAGTYGHYLLNIDEQISYSILDKIHAGDFRTKPGWVRASLHPTMSNAELDFLIDAIEMISIYGNEWAKDYTYKPKQNSYFFNGKMEETISEANIVEKWFENCLKTS